MSFIADNTEGGDQAYVRAFALYNLTKQQKSAMRAHADGALPVVAGSSDYFIRKRLAAQGLLKFDRIERPKSSAATARGRRVIVTLLAIDADRIAERELVS